MGVRVFLMMSQGQSQSAWTSFVPLVIMLGIFYFLLIAPMRKRQKQQEHAVNIASRIESLSPPGGC